MVTLASVLFLAAVHPQAKLPSFPANLTRGPAVVVLLKEGCPCIRECKGMLNALADACRGKIRFIGLIDTGTARAVKIVKESELTFPVLPDPNRVAIRALNGHEALDLRLLDRSGRNVGAWNGLSRYHASTLFGRIHDTFQIDVVCDLQPFTKLLKVGCEFTF